MLDQREQAQLSQAATRCAYWVERRVPGFLLGTRRPPRNVADVRPLAELLLILRVLTADRVPAVHRAFAAGIGAHIRPAVGTLTGAVDWAAVRPDPSGWSVGMALAMCVPLAEALTGEPLPAHEPALATIRACAAAPNAPADVLYASDVAGLSDHGEMMSLAVEREVADLSGGRLTRSSALYHLTHYLLYATDAGRRPGHWDPATTDRLSAALPALAAARLDRADHDLAAELLLAHAWISPDPAAAQLDRLAAAVQPDGHVPQYAPAVGPKRTFLTSYHPVLVTLAALAVSTHDILSSF